MYRLLSTLFAGFLAETAHAYAAPRNFSDFSYTIISLANQVTIILFTLALMGFLWGVVQTVRSSGDAEGIATGKKIMLYGIISLFVAISLWGIIFAAKLTLFGTRF